VADDPSSDDCSICVGSMKGISIVEAAGEIDMADVSLLAKALNEAAESGRGDVLVDAQNLTYIDRSGLQTLLSSAQRLAQEGRSLAIVGCHGVFYKLIEAGHLRRQLPMYSSVNEAMAEMEHVERLSP